jgi:2-dehydro-3-deoxyphosphooctonate aldolase (KDO 8-P synthase)
MPQAEFKLDHGPLVGNAQPLTLIAGPCVIEGRGMLTEVAGTLKELCAKLGVTYVFKSSYDKANRSSVTSFRGPGLEAGLADLAYVKEQAGVAVLSDVHDITQVTPAAEVLDIIQIPAFLCRQTDLLVAAAQTGKVVNVKKGQFMAPWDMANVWGKLSEGGCERVIVTERGASFGYNNLVVDFRSLLYFKQHNVPCCFDATHSVQLPGGAGTASSGQREYVAGLSTAAISLGIAALFWEVHPDPDNAKCDGPNQLKLSDVPALLSRIVELDRWGKGLA